jgi:hypothetical protein
MLFLGLLLALLGRIIVRTVLDFDQVMLIS